MEVPVLPVDHIAGDGVVLALRLRNIQWLMGDRFAVAAIIRTRLHRHRNDRTFFDFDDLLLDQVNHRHQVFNRVRPVVTVPGIQIAHHFQQAIFLFQAIFAVKVADRQRGGHHFAWVIDTAFFQRVGILLAAGDDLLHRHKVIQQHHAVGIFDRLPVQDLLILQIHQRFDNKFTVQHGDIRLTRRIHRRAIQHKIPHFGFLRLGQRNLGKAGVRFEVRRGFHNLDGLFNFICG